MNEKKDGDFWIAFVVGFAISLIVTVLWQLL